MLKLIISILLFSALTACGGGGGGSTPSLVGVESNHKSAAGIWDNDLPDVDDVLNVFVDEHSDAMFYVVDAPLFLNCQLTINGNEYSCNPTPDYSVTGTIKEKDRLSGTISYQGEIKYDFEVIYDVERSDHKVSMSDLNGQWQNIESGFTTTLTIDNDGDIVGSDSAGCTINGNLEYVSPNINVQTLKLEYSNCTNEGVFTGKGVFYPEFTPINWQIYASSDDKMINSFFEKQ